MSCNCPLLAERGEKLPSGKYKYLPIGRYSPELKRDRPDAIMIPCGQCAGCRADKTRKWADRMILEFDASESAIFVTLTYDNNHVPVVYNPVTGESEVTLSKRDCQLFMKRLRKEFPEKRLRFYLAAEYGPSTGRPHYHAIIYGLSLNDFEDLTLKGCNPLGMEYFVSEFFATKIWRNGFCLLANVSWRTCAYVARYVRKKQFGRADTDTLEFRLKEPVFALMSRRPGIGMTFFEKHFKNDEGEVDIDCFEKSKFYLSDEYGSVEVWMPEIFLRQLEKLDNEKYLKLKKERMSAAENNLLAKLSQTDVAFDELCDRELKKMEESGNYIDSLQFV